MLLLLYSVLCQAIQFNCQNSICFSPHAMATLSSLQAGKLFQLLDKRLFRFLGPISKFCTTEHSQNVEEHLAQLEKATKRRDVLHHRRAILKAVRTDSLVEKSARTKELRIPLSTVKDEWVKTRGLREVSFLAKYYGIFRDIFGGKEFKPSVWLDVDFENQKSHRGNIIQPAECLEKPKVSFQETADQYHSLILVNPDGCYPPAEVEILHWMVVNAPGSNMTAGKELSYMPPLPWKGSGFHRMCLALFAHEEPIDITDINKLAGNRLKFCTAEFLEEVGHNLQPVGLSWFQVQWDASVTESAEKLGIFEPKFEWEEFKTPKQLNELMEEKIRNNKYRIKFTKDDILLAQ